MSRFSMVRWLQALERQSRHAPQKRRSAGRSRAARFVPRLEALEDRTVPSTFLVTNLHDSGAGSLRAAIQNADATSGATINFAPGLHGTITLTSGQLNVTSNMTINGPGATVISVSGNNASRVFDIGNSATATINGLTIANGSAQSTTDPTQQGGGGVLNEVGSTVHLNNDILRNNQASVVGGALWDQAGPTGSASATISGSLFIGNRAIGSVNGTTNPFMLFEGFSPGNGTAEGGAIDNDGSLSIDHSVFTNNQAVGVPGTDGVNASAHGGALSVDGSVSITTSSFTGNQALAASVPAGFASAQGVGGGVIVFGSATISGSSFTGNKAVGGAGGTAAASNSAFVGAGGGVLVLSGGTLTVSDSVFTQNQAIGGAGGAGGGGGLGVGGGLDAHAGATLTLSNSAFYGNTALGGTGGSGAAGGDGLGGGLSVDDFSTGSITGIALLGNQAIGGTGGAGANGGNGLGGGLDVGGRSLYDGPDNSSVTLSNALIAGNLALGGTGGTGGNGGNGFGGGIVVGGTEVVGGVTFTPSLAVSDSAIIFNSAIGGEEGAGGSDGQGIGGGVYSLGDFGDVDTVIAFNHASTSNDNTYP